MDVGTMGTPVAQPSAEQIVAQLKNEQNFALAIPAGILAAIVGAGLWAAVALATKMELGLIAVAVGALIGYAIKLTGKGIETKFGVLGAICSAFGWALGTVLCDIAFLSQAQNVPFLQIFQAMNIERLRALVSIGFEPMDLLFLAITVYEGFKFSFRLRLKKN